MILMKIVLRANAEEQTQVECHAVSETEVAPGDVPIADFRLRACVYRNVIKGLEVKAVYRTYPDNAREVHTHHVYLDEEAMAKIEQVHEQFDRDQHLLGY